MKTLIRVLLVEDNPADAFLIKEAFTGNRLQYEFSESRNGEEAVAYLQHSLEQDELLPDVVLLDINLPRLNGFEVLKHIKQHAKLRHLPVVMLTTSGADSDRKNAYENAAACFITKPYTPQDMVRSARAIEHLCLNLNT